MLAALTARRARVRLTPFGQLESGLVHPLARGFTPRSQLGSTFDAGRERPNSLAKNLRDGTGNLSRMTMKEVEGLRVCTMVECILAGMEFDMPFGSMSSDGRKPGVRIKVDLRFV